MNRDAKITEGRQLMEAGDKCVKTSLFKWTPDFDAAASNYDKAGNCFKLGKDHASCAEAFTKAAEAHEKCNNLFHAAKALENAAAALKDNKSPSEAARLLQRASVLYRRHGVVDAASTATEKGAACAEQANDLPLALTLYLESVEMWETEEKLHMMKTPLQKGIQIAARLKDFEKLSELLGLQAKMMRSQSRWNDLSLNTLARIVVQIKLGDTVAAEKAFTEALGSVNGFANSDEGEAAELLLKAWGEGDAEGLAACLGKQSFTFLDNELGKLARSLASQAGGGGRGSKGKGETMSELEAAMSAVQVRSHLHASGAAAASTAAAAAEEEQGDGGLC